ncbi:porin [Chitinimonas lacunae]|uniref:Porin n=1 Tax=Chitinimonas lacunae TaxID=1963018 RepID=A0ABV8MS98_9NEIS
MNKKLIALAVASAAVAPAAFAADSEVVMYGQVNLGVVIDSHYLGTGEQLRVENLGTSSRIGFKGSEKLGNGLTAWFRIENGLAPDDASASGWATREGWVGLKGDFGNVALGRGKSAYQLAVEEFDWFDGPLTLGINEVDGLNASRFNNTIKYMGDFGPVSFSFDWGLGENKGNGKSAGRYNSASLKYTMGDLWFIGAGDVEKDANRANRDRRDALLGLGWGSGPVAVAGAYQYASAKDTGVKVKRNSFLVTGSYSMDNLTLKAGLDIGDKQRVNGTKVADSQFVHSLLGVNYALSKRTKLMSEYGRIDFKKPIQDKSTFTVGVMHAF